MKKIITLLFCTLLSSVILAYPITPRPLRLLVKESKFIIRGKVIEIGHQKESKNDTNPGWDRDYADIRISEVLQGVIQEKTVRVFFCAGMICPEPGTFEKGEEVLTFLSKRENKDGYYVHALSYGVKHNLTEAGFYTYKTRINEMQDILTKDEDEQAEPIIEWLVKCAENKDTRWEGTYELSQADRYSFFKEDDVLSNSHFSLTRSQRKRLFDAFMNAETLDYPELSLPKLIKKVNDCQVLKRLKEELNNLDISTSNNYFYLYKAEMITSQIVSYSNLPELKKIHEGFSKLHFWEEEGKAEGDKLLQQFQIKMKEDNCGEPVIGGDITTG